MKNICFISIVLFLTGFVFTGCEDVEHYVPKDTPSVFSFPSATAAVDEATLDKDGNLVNVNTLTVTVMWSKYADISGSVNIQVYPRTNVPAIEGEDYTISSKTLDFSAEQYTQTFTITTKYDDTFTGKKTFTVKLQQSDDANARIGAFGASDSCVVTINDANHPLTALIGNVTLSCYEYFSGGVQTYDSSIVPDEKDVNILWLIPNIHANANDPFKMEVERNEDEDGSVEFKVIIKLPQEAGYFDSSSAANRRKARWEGTFTLNEYGEYDPDGDDWDIGLYDDKTGEYTFIPVVLTGTTGEDKIKIEFDNAFWISVYSEDYTSSGDDGWIGYSWIGLPGTFVIEKL